MSTKRMGLLAGAAMLLAAVPVLAQPGPGGPSHGRNGGFAMGEAFARADANSDGSVSRDEGLAWLQTRFQEVDADRDGGVSLDEFRAFATNMMGGRAIPSGAEQRGQGMFRALDSNGDGKVSLDEIRPFAEAMFRARDTDANGALTRAEVRPERRSHRVGQQGAPAERRAPAPQAN